MTLHTLTLPARLVVGDESQDIEITVWGEFIPRDDEGDAEFQMNAVYLECPAGRIKLPFDLSSLVMEAIGEKAMEMIQEGQG